MSGGEISGNTASYSGGGVCVDGGTFTKSGGGTIYGSDAEAALRNTASGDSYGHAVYAGASPVKIRNATVGPDADLDSAVSGAAGGWIESSVFIQINLQPVADSPVLDNTSLFVNQTVQFSAGDGYASYQWYWNGTVIDGATSAAYNLPADSKAPGIYELSVIVTTGSGQRLSARCRVTIKAN
jgi:hypothetical protein